MVKNESLGIIGFGRFGMLAARYLKSYFDVFVSDISDKKAQAEEIGVSFVDIKECAKKNIVLLCVPISQLKNILIEINPFLKEGSLLLDVCSVKEKPVNSIKKIIPKYCECIGTHPLFGPDTIESGLEGKKIVLCPIRTKKLEKVVTFLQKLGLEVIISTPEEHDEQMARSLALIHLLGRALLNIGVERNNMATPTHERLMELVDIVRNDPNQLFLDMQTKNRFAANTRKALIKQLVEIDDELDKIEDSHF
ncbi:MAG: prephenate dehydrogenase/arogenate dehydrogenase family protein [Promethearchaeota archaeon]